MRGVLEDAPGGGTHVAETAEPTPTTPTGREPHPFVVTHEYAPGTLPRLRYGRDYSFRAWGVDLGGNVRAHHVGPRPPALDEVAEAVATLTPLSDAALVRRLRAAAAADTPRLAATFASAVDPDGSRRDVGQVEAMLPVDPDAPVVGEVVGGGAAEHAVSANDLLLGAAGTSMLHTVVAGAALGRPAAEAVDTVELPSLRGLGRSWCGHAPRPRRAPSPAAGLVSRSAAVGAAFRRAAAAGDVARSTVTTDVALNRDLLAGHLADLLGGPQGPARRYRVFAARPRWSPRPAPSCAGTRCLPRSSSRWRSSPRRVAAGARRPLRGDPGPRDARGHRAASGGVRRRRCRGGSVVRGSARRHLAPPKTSQVQAELHGVFDPGIDDEGTAAARRRVLAWALRESGTWYDREVPHPTDPAGAPSPQPGVRLLPEPDGGDHHNPHDPQRPLKVLPRGRRHTARARAPARGRPGTRSVTSSTRRRRSTCPTCPTRSRPGCRWPSRRRAAAVTSPSRGAPSR